MDITSMDLPEYAVNHKSARRIQWDSLQQDCVQLGYPARIEQGNLIIGDPSRAGYLITAGNTLSGIVALREITRILPESQRSGAAFVVFGYPRRYCKIHKNEIAQQTVIHLGDMGSGDEILFQTTAKLFRDHDRLTPLCKAVGRYGRKSVAVRKKAFGFHQKFPYGATVLAKPKRNTPKTMDPTNVNLICAAIVTLITQ